MRVEIRSDSVVIDGYVNAVARDSRRIADDKGVFVEQIVPKAFERALQRAKEVALLLNHDSNKKVGSTTEGNLKLTEDAIGLRAHCEVSDPTVIDKAKRGLLRGWSFGFKNPKERREPLGDGLERRYISDLDLVEVSIIDNERVPCYEGTSIEARADEEDGRLLEVRADLVDSTVAEEPTAETPSNYEVKNTLQRAMID